MLHKSREKAGKKQREGERWSTQAREGERQREGERWSTQARIGKRQREGKGWSTQARKGERQRGREKGLLVHIMAPMLLMNASTNKTKKRKIT